VSDLAGIRGCKTLIVLKASGLCPKLSNFVR